jgi:hypothetical protein
MTTTDGKKLTPLKAAKLAYVEFGGQAEYDMPDALEHIGVEHSTFRERSDFYRHLQTVDKRVRKMLRV